MRRPIDSRSMIHRFQRRVRELTTSVETINVSSRGERSLFQSFQRNDSENAEHPRSRSTSLSETDENIQRNNSRLPVRRLVDSRSMIHRFQRIPKILTASMETI